MPILLPIAVAAFFITYWIDKFMLLRVYKRPIRFDQKMASKATGLLPWAVLLHLSFGMWMFGNGNIFPSSNALAEAKALAEEQAAEAAASGGNATVSTEDAQA